jgi:cytochrome c oxidase subunit I
MSEQFRVSPETGLKFYDSTEKLIKANAVAAVVFLLIGGAFGLLVGLTRWPAVHLLPADAFYLVLTAHGLNVLIFWCIFFEMAVLYFCSSVLLGCRMAMPKVAWAAFGLMVIGALMNNFIVLTGEATVMMTSYAPMEAHPLFYLSLILFAVGALICCFIFFGTLVIAKEEKTYEGSVPLVTFGAITAAIIAVFTIASGAIILVPTLLWSLGFIAEIDALMYRLIWWGFGHSSQQVNVAAHIAVWYAIASIVFGAKPMSEKVSRFAFFMYILFLQIASVHHLLADPGVSEEFKMFNTSYAMYLAVMASMVHGLTVPGSIETAQRAKGLTNGLFEWLRRAPWGNPTFSGMFISLVGFGFIGGISGVTMSVEQINILIHNTIYVPGHFHATVVIGTTLAFMALTYWLVPIVFRRELIWNTLASWQPYLFGFGMVGVSMFLMGAGTLGVPRRHWDITFSQTGGIIHEFPAAANTLLALNGLSVILAVTGGAAFCLIIVGSILFGKKLGPDEKSATATMATPPTDEQYEVLEKSGSSVPGTLVLAMIFFVAFAIYYFINWKYLAETWGIS